MKALEIFKAKLKNEAIANGRSLNSELLPVLPVEKMRLVTAQARNDAVVASVATVTIEFSNGNLCNACDFLRLHELHPYSEYGYCKKGNKIPLLSENFCKDYQKVEPF